jgi:hypothetical protein
MSGPGSGNSAALADLLAGGLFFLLCAVIVGLFVWLAVHQYKKTKRRLAAVQAFVVAHGFAYLPANAERVTYFRSPPFGTGLNRRASHVVYGTVGSTPFETFAYQYETRHTDSKGHTRTQRHPFQVTWIPLTTAIPTMRLTADNALLRFGKKLGARDLDTESHDFNERWKVWCEDERVGHAVLTPRMIELLLRPELHRRAIVFEGRALMTYRSGHTDLSETLWLVGLLAEIRDLVPPFVLEDGTQGNPQ